MEVNGERFFPFSRSDHQSIETLAVNEILSPSSDANDVYTCFSFRLFYRVYSRHSLCVVCIYL